MDTDRIARVIAEGRAMAIELGAKSPQLFLGRDVYDALELPEVPGRLAGMRLIIDETRPRQILILPWVLFPARAGEMLGLRVEFPEDEE